jgi:signal transduction histidine kinase
MDPTVAQLVLQDRKIAYVITDRDLSVVEVGGAVDVLGCGRETCLGRSLLELVPELLGCEAVLTDILAGDYRDRTGRITGLLHLVEDVTEMGTIDQQLAQSRNELRLLEGRLARQNLELAAANAELRRLDEMKSQFIAVATHELRRPLTAIRGYLEMLLDEEFGPLADDQRQSLEVVQKSARRLRILTNKLLDVTRIGGCGRRVQATVGGQIPAPYPARSSRPAARSVRRDAGRAGHRQPVEQRQQIHSPGRSHHSQPGVC